MKMKKNSICILLAVLVLLTFSAVLFQNSDSERQTDEKKAVLIPEERDETTDITAVQSQEETPANSTSEDQLYYLVVEDGYLSVYRGKDTFYAYTDIRFDELDAQTQEAIRQGLSFSDEKMLYDFLENHSS